MEIKHIHFSGKIVKRSKGKSAVAAAAYRAGAVLVNPRDGLTHDYSRKKDVQESVILAPNHAPNWVYDRQELWGTVELVENRINSQTARDIEIGLPRELPENVAHDLLIDFVQSRFVQEGMIADISFHKPQASDGGENYHAHILLSMRDIEPDGFSKKKNRDWNEQSLMDDWRKDFADRLNTELAKRDIQVRYEHESYEKLGIDKLPQPKMGAAFEMEERGISTERGDELREVKAYNELVQELVDLEKEIQIEQMAIAETDLNDSSEAIRADMAAKASQKRRTTAETPRRADAGPSLKIEVKQGNKQGFKKKLLRSEYYGLEIDSDLLRQVRISQNMPSLVTLNDGAKITDFGSKITTKNATENSFALMAEMARAKGWQSVVLDGEKSDQIAMARELTARGIEVSTSDREILEIIEKAKEQSAPIAPPAHAAPMPGMPGTGNQKNDDDDYWRSRREILEEKPKSTPATDDEKASFRREWRSSYQINDSEQFAQTQAEIEARALQKEFDVRADYERQRQEELKRKKEQELKNQYVPKPPVCSRF
jgi:hypothetical protein